MEVTLLQTSGLSVCAEETALSISVKPQRIFAHRRAQIERSRL